jgi:hypothetical protein
MAMVELIWDDFADKYVPIDNNIVEPKKEAKRLFNKYLYNNTPQERIKVVTFPKANVWTVMKIANSQLVLYPHFQDGGYGYFLVQNPCLPSQDKLVVQI